MKELTTPTQAPVASPGATTNIFNKILKASTFLTLEHVAHMLAVVAVSLFLANGVSACWNSWFNGSVAATGLGLVSSDGIGIVAGLLVLVPLVIALDRRTRNSWQKNTKFAGEIGYKLPMFTTLGVLSAILVTVVISLVTVVLSSLAYIGVEGSEIGKMYLHEFLPALFAGVIYGGATWYVFNLAKGRDYGRTYTSLLAIVAVVVAVALYITTIVDLHETDKSSTSETSELLDDYEEWLNEWYSR